MANWGCETIWIIGRLDIVERFTIELEEQIKKDNWKKIQICCDSDFSKDENIGHHIEKHKRGYILQGSARWCQGCISLLPYLLNKKEYFEHIILKYNMSEYGMDIDHTRIYCDGQVYNRNVKSDKVVFDETKMFYRKMKLKKIKSKL